MKNITISLKKSIGSLALACTIIACPAIALAADTGTDPNISLDTPVLDAPMVVADTIMVYGSILDISEDGEITAVHIKNSNDQDPYQEIILNIGPGTMILNAANGAVLDIDSLKADATIYAYTSQAMTRSIPAQSNAEVILVDIPADMGAPNYVTVNEIIENEDGSITLNTDRDLLLSISEDTMIKDQDGNDLAITDINESMKLLAYYQMMTLSLPAQAHADQVVLLSTPMLIDDVEAAPIFSIATEGVDLNQVLSFEGAEPIEQDGVWLMPLRQVMEANGYTVSWDAATRGIELSKEGSATYTLATNNANAVMDDAEALVLSQPIINIDGSSYIALDDINTLYGSAWQVVVE